MNEDDGTGRTRTGARRGEDGRTGADCPICGKPAHARFRPFCSSRCADVDLHRWLVGAYRVPAVENDEDEADEAGDGRG